MSQSIGLWVNGIERRFGGGSLRELLLDEGIVDRPGIAVAVNGQVIPRADWDRHEPSVGDEVEIVAAVQGG